MRTLIDIPDDLIDELDALARRRNRSRAAEMRDALTVHVREQTRNDWIARGAGYWKDREDIRDGLEYQLAIREDRTQDW
jgi:predicted transcriptional regulator